MPELVKLVKVLLKINLEEIDIRIIYVNIFYAVVEWIYQRDSRIEHCIFYFVKEISLQYITFDKLST